MATPTTPPSPNTPDGAAAVAGLRDEVAGLLFHRGPKLGWAVALCLAEAHNHLDLADPATPTAASFTETAPPAEPDPRESTLACIERLRVSALQLIDAGTVAHVYALGHAAGELAGAAREITQARPA